MKEFSLSITILLSSLLLIGAGCQNSTPTEPATPLPPEVVELQTQTIPETQKQPADKQTVATPKNNFTLYRGTYFDIQYPKGFSAKPTTPTSVYNNITSVQTDEAYFTSPDGAVDFFVFSPLWGGDPTSYLNIKNTEELVNEKTTESGSGYDKKIVRWVTVKAKNNLYYRSFVSIKNQVDTGSDTHRVFGIQYKDSTTYDKYRETYLTFKGSLRQYAD